MKTEATRNGRRVVAISGKHSVGLAMQWPADELDGLLGFSIRRKSPDRNIEWLPAVLRFEGEPIEKGKLYPSDVAPIQSMLWGDFGLKDEKLGYWLGRAKEDKMETAREFWAAIHRGQAEAFEAGAEVIPDILTPAQAEKSTPL